MTGEIPDELFWILEIVDGHGWDKHGQYEFDSKEDYQQAILETVQNATGKDVQHPDKFRTLFWNDKEEFAVWRDKETSGSRNRLPRDSGRRSR